jgi:nitronate monooxygenase
VGLLEATRAGLLVMPMAERLSRATAARLTAGQEAHGYAMVALDEGLEDEAPPPALADRLAFQPDLSEAPAAAPFTGGQVAAARERLARVESDDALIEAILATAMACGITSLRAPGDVVKQVHGWGGIVFHDVTSLRHAEKALEAGVDGLVLVAAGAGGHAGTLSPFALVAEVRRIWDGPIALSGSITRGDQVLAAQAMGADLAYMGTRFIATAEANAAERYKAMIVESAAADIVYTPFFTGVPGNYLKPSIAAQGLDPDALPAAEKSRMKYGSEHVRPWKDIWGAGQGVGSIADTPPAAEVIARLKAEYATARARLCADTAQG